MSYRSRGVQARLAEVLRDSGRGLDEATRLYKELLDYETKHWGNQHPTVLLTEAELARCLELRGSPNAAKTYQKAYAIFLKTWGEEHYDVKKVRGWIEAARNKDELKE